MKNIWKSLFVAALFVSCSEPMTEGTVAPEVNNGKAIQFEVVNEGGRAAFFQGGHGVVIEEGDLLSIRHFVGESVEDCKAYAEGEGTFPDDDAKNAWLNTNVQRGNYKKVDGAWVFQSGKNYQDISWVNGIENTICAFMLPPSVKSDNRYANAIKRATLSGTQVQAAANDYSHIGDYMIMGSDPQKFAAGVQPEKVSIQLQNVLSIVEVTLKSEVAKTVTSLSLASKTTPLAVSGGSVVMDATKKVSTGVSPFVVEDGMGVNEVKLTLTEAAEVTAEGAKFYFVVLPGEHAAGDITLTANFAGGTYAEKQMGAIEFKMNKVYRPEVAFAAADVKVAEEIELHFDFTSVPTEDNGTKWGTATNINNCKKAASLYQAPKTFAMLGYSGLEFTFTSKIESKTDYKPNFGTCYERNASGTTSCLSVIPGNTGQTTQTVGLPVLEGYKLVRVEGYRASISQDYHGTYVAITSNKEGITVKDGSMQTDGSHEYADVVVDDSTIISEFEGMTAEKKVIQITKNQTTAWTLTIPTAQKNTRYYLSVSGPYLRVGHLYLTYELVNE